MNRHSLAWHLAVRFALVCFVALVASAWIALRAIDGSLERAAWSELETTARLVAVDIAPALRANDAPLARQVARRASESTDVWITVVQPSGKVLFDSRGESEQMANQADLAEVKTALAGGVGREIRYSPTREEQVMYAAVPIRLEADRLGVVRVAEPTSEIEAVYADSLRVVIFGATLIGAAAALAGWWLVRRPAEVVRQLDRQAQQLASGQATSKLAKDDIVELSNLSASLNTIAQQLEERSLRIGRQGHEQAAILASMTEGVLAVDSDERIIAINSAAATLIAARQSEVQGRNLAEVLRNADLRRFVSRALQSPDPIEDDVVLHRELHNEGDRILQVRGAALRDGAGRSVGAVIVLNDVTHYRKLENLRRDFVANVSHELKTPIASIKGFVETLLDGAMQHPEDAQRFLRIIANHADRLNNIIEDLLSLSKIEQSEEAANLPMEPRPIKPVLEAAVAAVHNKAAQRQIEVELDCDDGLVAQINPLLEQAVMNLVDNAIKYSEPSSQVHVSAARQNGELMISVRDHGCGIARDHLPRLFERFYRVDRARSRKLGGTGLGLAIVKHIVQAHRGRVAVESVPGEGSIFSIHLPD